MNDQPLLLKLFYKNSDYEPSALWNLWLKNGMKKGRNPMSVKCFRKMIKKFEKTGSLDFKFGRGRKSIASISVEDVAT